MSVSDQYFAGLFDGEGTLRISYNGRQYQLLASLGMTHRNPIDSLLDRFGGWVETRQNTGTKWKPIYVWRASSTGALLLIEAIHPYLLVKNEHARVALEFQSLIGTKLPMNHPRKQALYHEMRELNKRGR